MEKFIIKSLSDVEKIEKVPFSQRMQATSTYDVLRKSAEAYADLPAISYLLGGADYQNPFTVTYTQFLDRIHQTANLLYELGVRAGDTVSYILPNIPQTHYVLWGAEAAGIANPISPLLEAQAIEGICRAANTKVLICLPDMPGSDIWQKVDSIRKNIPTLKYVIQIMGQTDESENIIGFEAELERFPSDRLVFNRDFRPEDIASLYHTGGTTGLPKLAMRTHENECANSRIIHSISPLKSGDTLLCGLPLFHCNGTILTGLALFSFGGHVVLCSPFGFKDRAVIDNFYKIVEKFRVKGFSAVPTVLSALLEVPVGNADISSMEYLVCGAAPLSVELFRRFEEHTGIIILEGYGLTEGTVSSTINPRDGERKIGSVGIRLPYQELKVIELDENDRRVRDLPAGEIGAVCIKGPNVFKGYLEDQHNRTCWIGDGWYNTGDLGMLDSDGYLWLTGRKKEIIIRGGHNIDPATIEGPLYKLPEIKYAAAIGRPDAYAGEVPVAYVQLAEDARLTEADILDWITENTAERAAVPKEVIVVPEMPLTPIGKIYKPALKLDIVRRVFENELQVLIDDALIHVNVENDRIHGMSARISFEIKEDRGVEEKRIRRKIAEILGMYSIHYTVSGQGIA